MTTNPRVLAAALNREIIDDQPDRLSIHTDHIRLTQANLPYQLVPGKRLPSEKHLRSMPIRSFSTAYCKTPALHVFSHRPRLAPYKIDYKNPANTAGGKLGEDSQGYIGVSPFALWRLDFNLRGNEWLDVSTVNTVQLTFSGRFLGPTSRLR